MVGRTAIAIRLQFALPTYFSGAVGECREFKSQLQNKKTAFLRMAQSEAFKKWHKIEVARRLGQLESIEEAVDRQMNDANFKIEYTKG